MTNPGENSFRAYLTEQSFRQHLSRLDDASDGSSVESDDILLGLATPLPAAPPVHFASRASVSLRTPRHILHNCGLLTLGAVVPDERARRRSTGARSSGSSDLERAAGIADSWYVGAFGRWWRGGVLDAWWLDMVAKAASTPEDGTCSGILGITTLDKREGGLPDLR